MPETKERQRDEAGDALSPSKSQSEDQDPAPVSLMGDYQNIAILIFLYILQGIPLGLADSIPLIMSARKIGYKEQAMFSLVFWPFSLKLLWAPIVDAAFFKRFGRRKSWLVPVQYILGLFMFILSWHITDLLGDNSKGGSVNVSGLTVVFFLLYFLAATQDIVVDGWALTMLSKKNVGWASTCNAVGQIIGIAISSPIFLALESPVFCNQYLRSVPKKHGLVTFSGFLYFWGIVFVLCTTLVWMFKKEKRDEKSGNQNCIYEIASTYKKLSSVVTLPATKNYFLLLITSKIGFAAIDNILSLKLVEKGIPKEKIAGVGLFMIPIQVILPFLIGKYTAGPRPIEFYLKAMGIRLLMGIVMTGFAWWTPSNPSGNYSVSYYFLLMSIYGLHQIPTFMMHVCIMSFHAKISDPKIGGTYMTLMNSLSNIASTWPGTIALYAVEILTISKCSTSGLSCSSASSKKVCSNAGGLCSIQMDGFYVESIICVIIGFTWLYFQKRKMINVQNLHHSAWSVT